MNIRKQKLLARLARKCGTKKEMLAAGLRGDDLAECRRIKAIQVERIERCHDTEFDPREWSAAKTRPLEHDYQRKQVKRSIWKTCRRWNGADYWGFQERISKQIFAGWKYKFEDKRYSLSVSHNRRDVTTEGSRAACSYTTFSLRIGFDLLRQEAVWIGGLLTVRAKSDRLKHSYPCRWFVRNATGPGLRVITGRIVRRNHHVEDETIVEARRSKARLLRQSKTCRPPKGSGWVTRQMSIDAGNCQYGTDSFIQNQIVPFFRNQGFQVGDLSGAAIRGKLLLKIDGGSSFVRRLVPV